MEIRNIERGETVSFAASARLAGKKEADAAQTAGTSPADRVELSNQWVEQMQEQMQEQNAQILSLLTTGKEREEQSDGLLDSIMQDAEAKQDELDALSADMKAKMKCLEIAMRIMKGKKVPPEDERYLMENDPAGYKIAMAMKAFVKEDDEECESVLDDEDKNGGKTESSKGGEDAPVESAPSEGGGEETAV